MNVKQLIGLSALALAAGNALAGDGSPTRADMRQQVLDARAAGTLTPAGEGVSPGYAMSSDRWSDVTRAQVTSEVLQARASGLLQPAGEGSPEDRLYARAESSRSTLARADVKAQVLEARATGELIPAGEGEYPNTAEATHVAHASVASGNFFAFLHRSH